MVILLSFITGLLTAAAGAFAAGAVAAGCVEWYRIPSREGGSGYFVLFIGLAGLIVGFVIGCACGAIMPADSGIGYLKAISLSLGVVILLSGSAAIIARLLADIPPTIDREHLFLVIEVQLPPDQLKPPAQEPGDMFVLLGSIPHGRRTVRKHERGPLFVDDAAQIGGRWIVRGAVELFTRRGRRMIHLNVGKKSSEGYIVPLPANPGKKYLEWSDWLPRLRSDGKPAFNRLTYRFRVQQWSEPMRVETVGPFEIQTITSAFYYETIGKQQFIASRDSFRIRYRGAAFGIPAEPAPNGPSQYDQMTIVATIAGTTSALLVQFRNFSGGCTFHLVSDSGETARSELIANGDNVTAMAPPTVAATETTDTRYRCPGRLALSPGLHRVGYDGVLDTRTLAIHRFKMPQDTIDSQSNPTLSISPDERSFVRHIDLIGGGDSKSKRALAVTDFVAGRSYLLLIDRSRMYYSRQSELNPAWLAHHFEWARDANGIDQLAERPDFLPLPYRGELSPDYAGGKVYRLEPVGEEMRTAVEDFLAKGFNAERQPGTGDYEHVFLIGGKKILVNCSADFDYVAVCTDSTVDASLGQAIADGFDAELATGKYDSLFRV